MRGKSGDVSTEPSTTTGTVAAVDGVDGAVRLPQIVAEVRDDGTGEISVDGVRETIAMADLAEAGAAITGRIAAIAADAGRALPVEVRDPDGLWALLIHPDGRVDEADDADLATLSAPVPVVDPAWSEPVAPPVASSTTPAPATPTPATPAPAPPTGATPVVAPTTGAVPGAARRAPDAASLPTLDDLLAARHPAHRGPAEQGWQRTVRRLTFGAVSPRPGVAERARRSQVDAIRRTFDGPRTVVVVNPKGGAHKTTATMLLASTFGLARGGYTLA